MEWFSQVSNCEVTWVSQLDTPVGELYVPKRNVPFSLPADHVLKRKLQGTYKHSLCFLEKVRLGALAHFLELV